MGWKLYPVSETTLNCQIFEWCLVGFVNPVSLTGDFWGLSKFEGAEVKQVFTEILCRQNVDDVRSNTYQFSAALCVYFCFNAHRW